MNNNAFAIIIPPGKSLISEKFFYRTFPISFINRILKRQKISNFRIDSFWSNSYCIDENKDTIDSNKILYTKVKCMLKFLKIILKTSNFYKRVFKEIHFQSFWRFEQFCFEFSLLEFAWIWHCKTYFEKL